MWDRFCESLEQSSMGQDKSPFDEDRYGMRNDRYLKINTLSVWEMTAVSLRENNGDPEMFTPLSSQGSSQGILACRAGTLWR
jgi:hypothetical protein